MQKEKKLNKCLISFVSANGICDHNVDEENGVNFSLEKPVHFKSL